MSSVESLRGQPALIFGFKINLTKIIFIINLPMKGRLMFQIAGGIILVISGIFIFAVLVVLAVAFFKKFGEWWHHNNGVQ